MNNTGIKINILIDSLINKLKSLQKLLELTKEQEKLLKKDELDYDKFHRLIDKKQKIIDKILEIDEGFKSLYEDIRESLKLNKDLYQNEIKKMKDLIKDIGEVGISIQVLENRNKQDFEIKTRMSKNKIKEFKKSKKAVVNYYNNINKQRQTENSFFFDSKK